MAPRRRGDDAQPKTVTLSDHHHKPRVGRFNRRPEIRGRHKPRMTPQRRGDDAQPKTVTLPDHHRKPRRGRFNRQKPTDITVSGTVAVALTF